MATNDFCLAMAAMAMLEQRRTLQSPILFFKCFKLDGPNYISQFFTPQLRWLNTVLAVFEYMSFAKLWQEKGCSLLAESWQVKNILMKNVY